MLIYNKEWLDNLAIRKASQKWLKQGLTSMHEHEDVLKKYPSMYKTSGIFARIGLFIFTLIIVSAFFGLLCLMFLTNGEKGLTAFFIIMGLMSYGAAEYFVRINHLAHSGVVDALLYSAITFTSIGIIYALAGDLFDHEPIIAFLILLPLFALPAIRFADVFLALLAFGVLLIINALAVLKLGEPGKILLPFESMGLSYLSYTLIVKNKEVLHLRFWKNCFTVLEISSLVALYLSGNYMVIRLLTESLLGIEIQPGEEIKLAAFFYAFTIVVPAVYIWLGLKRKNYIFLRAGLLLLVAGILSIKYYHSIMPPETAMILAGTIMILLAYFSIRYLRTPKYGITFNVDDQGEKHQALVNIANIAISQSMSGQPQPVKSDSPEFGGGDFGGGGAGADF